MLGVGFVVTWAGYALGSWGWVLIKGWDICLREWVSPLHPYQWHRKPPPLIGNVNPGSVFPKCGGQQITAETAQTLENQVMGGAS